MRSVVMIINVIFLAYDEMCHHLETVYGVTEPHMDTRWDLSVGQINGVWFTDTRSDPTV